MWCIVRSQWASVCAAAYVGSYEFAFDHRRANDEFALSINALPLGSAAFLLRRPLALFDQLKHSGRGTNWFTGLAAESYALYAAAQTRCRAHHKLHSFLALGRAIGQAVTEMPYQLELVMNKRNFIIAAFLGIVLIGCAATTTQESTGEYIDDTTITTKVKSKLLLAKDTTGTAISVETFKGIVQLSGFVKSDQERQRAEEIAKSVDGVKRVENKISIRGS